MLRLMQLQFLKRLCVLLSQLVRFLCEEMTFAFRTKGVSLPPWRALRSMRSKWCPVASRDEVIAPSRQSSLELPSSPGSTAPVLRSATRAAVDRTAKAASERLFSSGAVGGSGHSTCSGSSSLSSKDSVLPASALASPFAGRARAAAANKVLAAPWKVQMGFQVPSGPSLLSQQLAVAAASPVGAGARSASPACSAGSPFDMWSHQSKRRASTEHPAAEPPVLRSSHRQRQQQQRQLEAMPAIRTVKMSGRSRA